MSEQIFTSDLLSFGLQHCNNGHFWRGKNDLNGKVDKKIVIQHTSCPSLRPWSSDAFFSDWCDLTLSLVFFIQVMKSCWKDSKIAPPFPWAYVRGRQMKLHYRAKGNLINTMTIRHFIICRIKHYGTSWEVVDPTQVSHRQANGFCLLQDTSTSDFCWHLLNLKNGSRTHSRTAP